MDKVYRWYRKDEKYYHTIHHVEDLYKKFNRYEKAFDEEFGSYDKESLFWAIAYHDCIYMPGCNCNEYLSATVAGEELDLIVSYLVRTKASNLIMTTAISCKNHFSAEEMILHDLDWMGFEDYEKMLENEIKIMNEAIFVGEYTDLEVMKGRLAFYKSLIGKTIYKTQTLAAFNEPAQANLTRRIKELENVLKTFK